MFNLKKWWQDKSSHRTGTLEASSAEWFGLKDALTQRDFVSISPCMRAWCRLAERDLALLMKTAEPAGFDAVELNKLRILFKYYSNKVVEAYDSAQEHMLSHGFDLDLHVISLVSLYQNNQFEDAHIYLSKLSVEQMMQIQRADYWQLVSVIRWATNDMKGLEQAADRAIALGPGDSAVLQTALGMYIELGVKEKIVMIRAQLDSMPDAQGYSYSLSKLALGELESGWRLMEARYDVEDAHRYLNQALKPFPRWRGEPLNGARLLITAEQGLGDTVQMARYLPMLAGRGVQQVVMETQPEALTLLQYNFPEMQIIERTWGKAPDLSFDLWLGMMSLPYFLKAWGTQTPGKSGYLRVPPDATAYWQPRVTEMAAGKGPRIGLAWSGQPAHRADRRRSVPFNLMMRYVSQVTATFFALQTHVPEGLAANVINVSEEMITLADTLALIEQMDMVITVDTSVVHLAGSIGKETWLLLPKRYEWRWGLEGEHNDWYDSVKVLRQDSQACWEPLMEQVFLRYLPARFANQEII